MASYQPVSFQSPGFDYGADISQIERRRAMAQMLQQQGTQPIQEQPTGAGQFAVPISPFQGAAKMGQILAASRQQHKADDQQRQLAQTSQSNLASVLMNAQKAAAGTPGTALSEDASGNVTPAQPAVAGDMSKAASLYMQHPATAQLGQGMMQQELQQQQRQRMMAQIMGGGTPQSAPNAAAGGSAPSYGSPGFSPQGAPQQPSGPMSHLPPQIVGLMTSGDPELVKLGTTLADNYKLQNVRPGGTVFQPGQGPVFTAPQNGVNTTWNQGVPQSGVVQGAQEAAARGAGLTAGATEAGKAPFHLGTYNTPGGPTVLTNEQAIQRATGRPMPQPGSITAAGVNVPIGQGGGLRLQDQGTSRTEIEMGEGLGKRYNTIQDSGFTANNKINKYSRLGSLLENIDTGKFSPTGFEVAAYAKAAGMPVSDKLDNAQAAKAIANDLALELRNPSGGAGMPGAMSDADRVYLTSMIANIDKTPGANKLMIDGAVKLAQRDRQVAQLARDYKKKHGGFDDGFYDELSKFSESNPLFPKAGAGGGWTIRPVGTPP